mmetsp:Transcript_148757/g.273090  ORF Transcript_148757/g.273090 Transcript_148757/m.273090 type:complete len:673 (+) Transcript_148757:107-2125(+)
MARSSSDRSRGRSRSRRRAARRSRSRDRKKAKRPSRSRSAQRRQVARNASRSRERNRRQRSRSASQRPARKRSRSQPRKRSVTPRSRSRSRRARRRSRSPERVPPTDFQDYEPSPDGGGWYIYKKTGKWKYHPETGLYLHVKSKVYYVQKDGDARTFRKIEDGDDPVVKKMKQSEEMRKAIQSTEFVKFDESGNPTGEDDGEPTADDVAGVAPKAQPAGPEPKPPEPEKVEDLKSVGKVQKWDSEKGFGFIVSLGKDGEEVSKGIFVHRKNVVGSTPSNPINLKENGKVEYKPGEMDGRPCATEVMMLGADGKPLPIHAGAQTLEEKKKSYYVTADSLGIRVHAESWPGLKKTLQDRYASDEAMEELGVYFGVFDGHGGTQVADHIAKQLHKNIMVQFRQKQVQPASRDEKIRAGIKEAFLQTDKEILSMAERKKFEQVGSTAVTALLHGNPKLGTALRLVVANLGDSRAVLCRAGQAVAASEDHKPQRIDEKKRIERAGGLVLQVRGAWRVAASTNPNSMSKSARREYQGLAMTRSFGDLYFKKPTLLSVAEPEIQIIPLTDKDLFLVLATDGIYHVLSNQEVVDLALKHWDDPDEAAKQVVRTAYKRGSEDNLTVLVIQFGWADKNVQKYLERAGMAAARPMEGGSAKQAAAAAAMMTEKPADDGLDMFG